MNDDLKQQAKLRGAILGLLHELCVNFGFCIPREDQDRIVNSPPADADQFTQSVFAAEGMDYRLNLELFKQVRNRVRQHYRRFAENAD